MRTLLLLSVLAACSGDPPDGDMCTMSTYDPCTTEHDCANFICRDFTDFRVCTQACDPSNPCPPDSARQTGTCDNGVCKPGAPTVCEPR